MGMAASQARFLSLTARKTNVEFEGQQINQQRTSLSNESSNYYSQLCNMNVPTPPSSEDFTKTTYTFVDGSETNTINSLIAKKNGSYSVNYTQSFETESVVANGSVIVTKIDTGDKDSENNPIYTYRIGATTLRELYDDRTAAEDPYLKDLSPEQRNKVLELEKQYLGMLQQKYGDDSNWLVKYQKNSENGSYEPVFYNKEQVENADYSHTTGTSLSGIKSYTYGKTVETREIKNAPARVQQDTSGRYVSVILYEKVDPNTNEPIGNSVEYQLTATTECDDKAYNDAMNQYNYEKTIYNQNIQSINAKIEIVQSQDKDLELRLKQLDTEENAISAELEAIKKVISKNVDSSFKTFNA